MTPFPYHIFYTPLGDFLHHSRTWKAPQPASYISEWFCFRLHTFQCNCLMCWLLFSIYADSSCSNGAILM